MLSDTESRGAGDQATASTECQENVAGFSGQRQGTEFASGES
jgi:hypothetical protein